MKRALIIIIASFICVVSFCQSNIFPSSGNAGINTLTPSAYMHIRGGSGSRGLYLDLNDSPGGEASPMVLWDARIGGANYLFFARQENNNLQFTRYSSIWSGGLGILTLKGENGNIGIGTTSPGAKLDIRATGDGDALLKFNTDRPWTFYNIGTGSSARLRLKPFNNGKSFEITNSTDNIVAHFYTATNLDEQRIYFIPDGGNVGIGTTSPDYMLDVEGTIRAHEIKVNLDEGADFVFEEDYNLMPLNELETFVKTQKHLPEVATAKEMEAEGLNISEMNIKLLQKIEELTLYTIEQEKKIEVLKKQNNGIEELKQLVLQQNEEIENLKNKINQ